MEKSFGSRVSFLINVFYFSKSIQFNQVKAPSSKQHRKVSPKLVVIKVTPYPCDQSNKCRRNTSACCARLNILPYVRSLWRISLTNTRLRICYYPIVLRSFSHPCHCLPALLLPQPQSNKGNRRWSSHLRLWMNRAKTAKLGSWNGKSGTIFRNSYLLLGFHLMLKKGAGHITHRH